VRWQLLVATVEARTAQLCSLLDALSPQLTPHEGEVEVLVYRDNFEASVGSKRDVLVRSATADYVSHVDDDDMIVSDYISTIYPLLDGVDYVSFDLVARGGGHGNLIVSHSLAHIPEWTPERRLVDIGHLMPMKRELHASSPFGDIGWTEDQRWADQLRMNHVLHTEHHIDRVLYEYRVSDGSLWNNPPRDLERTPNPLFPNVRYVS
jgi:hypothetical protein